MSNLPRPAKMLVATFEVKVRITFTEDIQIGSAIKSAQHDLMSLPRVRSVTPIGELEDPYKEAAPL